MKLVVFSDTHGLHEKVNVPDGDVLIFAGDYHGEGNAEQNFYPFRDWFLNLPHKNKLIIAGNHDYFTARNRPKVRELLHPAIYLEDEEITIDGIKFWGTPWNPQFFDFPFMFPRNGKELSDKRELIPDNTDILISHSPAYGTLDYTYAGIRAGCELLEKRVKQLNLSAHIFGHIHESYGNIGNSYNVSLCKSDYQSVNEPTMIENI